MKATIKTRIIISVLLCFLAVWFPSVLILFSYMNREVYREAGNVVTQQIENAVSDVNDDLFSVVDSVAWICSDRTVSEAFTYPSFETKGAAVAVMDAQSRIAAYLAASPSWDHLNKIVIFSPSSNISFELVKWRSGSLSDVSLIMDREEYRNLSFPDGAIVSLMLGTTINTPYETAVIAYGRVRDSDAYVYAEFSSDIFSPIISSNPMMYIVSDEKVLPSGNIPGEYLDPGIYSSSEYSLEIPGVSAVFFQRLNPLRIISSSGLVVFIVVIAASVLLFVLISVLLSRYLTRASSKLVRHIEYLMETKDFGYTDKEIESGKDEIASIGHAVNAMSISISELLKRNEALFEDKKRMEIDMLQMQVNPHFLYNTLESMHYLAEVQKNDGIARMSRGLSTLLRNMAKGSSSKILLSEELSLLRDYDDIQQVRYMGMYEIEYDIPDALLSYRIQKFTLQPLVENSIFHGIEPSGRFGMIKIGAYLDDGDIVIAVRDDGVGMSADEIEHIFDERKHSKTDMTGVGLKNINERIKLVYGRKYGLSFESVKGSYTVVKVRIRAERFADV